MATSILAPAGVDVHAFIGAFPKRGDMPLPYRQAAECAYCGGRGCVQCDDTDCACSPDCACDCCPLDSDGCGCGDCYDD